MKEKKLKKQKAENVEIIEEKSIKKQDSEKKKKVKSSNKPKEKKIKKESKEKKVDKKKAEKIKIKKEKNVKSEEKQKKSKKINKKTLIILISSISAFLLALTLTLCLIFIKPNKGYELENIEVFTVGKVSGYKAFDEFNSEGFKIKANYSDGTFVILEQGWSMSYVSIDGQTTHDDCFYGGENKIKIIYNEKTCFANIEPVEKINRELIITATEYSQIYTGNRINIPASFVSVKDFDEVSISNPEFKVVYCTEFNNYSDFVQTTIAEGSVVNGGAPSKIGNYKAFVLISADQNYNELKSNVVDFCIVDESQINLCAKNNETFFGWRELSDATLQNPNLENPLDPTYIEFEIIENNGIKELKYHSSFADDGIAMIFDDHINLISDFGVSKIKFENNKISINNNEKNLQKWFIPSYLGEYKMIITPEEAEAFDIILTENYECSLHIYYDNENKDGKISFTLTCMEIPPQTTVVNYLSLSGSATYAIGQNGIGSLSFKYISGGSITELFLISNIQPDQSLNSILVDMSNNEGLFISCGEYIK